MTTPNSFSGKAQATTLTNTSGIGSGDTSFTVGSVSTWKETIGANVGQPLGYSGAFIVTLDYGTSSEERILCSGISGLTVNVLQRGYDGTTAIAHSFGATAVHTISTDVPYNANLGVTNAATALSTANTANTTANTANTTANTANTTANTANTTANSALTAATTIKSNIWTGSAVNNPATNAGVTNGSVTVSGYTNYLITAQATYYSDSAAGAQVSQSLTVNGTAGLALLNIEPGASASPNVGSLTSTYCYSPGSTGSFTVTLQAKTNVSGSTCYVANLSLIHISEPTRPY